MDDVTIRSRWTWGLVAAVAALGAMSALYVAVTPAGDQTPLANRTWEQLAGADAEVASIVSRLLVVLGLLGAAFGALSLVVALCRTALALDGPGTRCCWCRSHTARSPLVNCPINTRSAISMLRWRRSRASDSCSRSHGCVVGPGMNHRGPPRVSWSHPPTAPGLPRVDFGEAGEVGELTAETALPRSEREDPTHDRGEDALGVQADGDERSAVIGLERRAVPATEDPVAEMDHEASRTIGLQDLRRAPRAAEHHRVGRPGDVQRARHIDDVRDAADPFALTLEVRPEVERDLGRRIDVLRVRMTPHQRDRTSGLMDVRRRVAHNRRHDRATHGALADGR